MQAPGLGGVSVQACSRAAVKCWREHCVDRSTLSNSSINRIAVVWRSTENAPEPPGSRGRFGAIFQALEQAGISAIPVIYSENTAEAVREQLLAVSAALVWVNPLQDGKDRAALNTLLTDVAEKGVWVSAHPEIILKLGVKEVLFTTRHMSWGCDTRRYCTLDEFRAGLPQTLAMGPRVIKRNRGNGGQGVWRVERLADEKLLVLDATKEDQVVLNFTEFVGLCLPYLEDGCIIDQQYQKGIRDGAVRCYMAGDRCAGFGHQKVRALVTDYDARVQAGPRVYTPPEDPQFTRLRDKMENEWTPQLMALLDIQRDELPAIWDADFIYGAPDKEGADNYVLCEINVSSVFPMPDSAPAQIARLVAQRLTSRQ